MPRFDGTGPSGDGPRTGWGRGPCGGGMGRRRGWGWFDRFRGQSKMTEKEEVDALNEEAETLEKELKAVKEHLAELRTKK